jgi:DNA-binding MarR family transcriptional regulator
MAGSYTPSELADLLLLETQTVSALTRRLERRGLIERLQHPLDRRSVLLRVTPDGESAVMAVAPAVLALADQLEEAAGKGDLLVAADDLRQAARGASSGVPTIRRTQPRSR